MKTLTLNILKYLAILTFVFGSVAFPLVEQVNAAPAQAEPTGFVNTGRLNVRSGPYHTYSVVVVMDKGQGFTLIGRNTPAKWVQIKLPSGITGWVNVGYIKTDAVISNLPVTGDADPATTAPTAVINTGRLNVRSGPDPYASVLKTVDKGATVNLLGRNSSGTWAQVRTADGTTGWVKASYLKPSVAISTLAVTGP